MVGSDKLDPERGESETTMRLLINTKDGSVVPVQDTFLVIIDGDDAEDVYKEWHDTGRDDNLLAYATKNGKNLGDILDGCGDGDLRYGNSVSLSPKALMDEIASRIGMGIYDDEQLAVLETFTQDDLEWICESILSQDYIWNTVNNLFDDYILEAIYQKRKEEAEKKVPLDLV